MTSTLPYRLCTYAQGLTFEEAQKTAEHFKSLGFADVQIQQPGRHFTVIAQMRETTRRVMYPEDYEVRE